MAFPASSPTSGTAAQSLAANAIAAAGLAQPTGGLNQIDYLAAAVGALMTDSPPAQSIVTTGQIRSSSPTAGIGYNTGAGAAVTQATNRTTGVTCTGLSGAITTNNASLAAEAAAEFTVTNTSVAIGDVVVCSQRSGSNGGNTEVYTSATAAGSFNIKQANNNAAGGTAETGAIIVNFIVLKAVSA